MVCGVGVGVGEWGVINGDRNAVLLAGASSRNGGRDSGVGLLARGLMRGSVKIRMTEKL